MQLLQCNCFHSSYLSIRCYGGGSIGIGPNYHRFVQLGWSMGHYITMVDWREKFTRSKGRPGPRYDDDDADFDYAESPVPVLR